MTWHTLVALAACCAGVALAFGAAVYVALMPWGDEEAR